jgi:hypothetical protein
MKQSLCLYLLAIARYDVLLFRDYRAEKSGFYYDSMNPVRGSFGFHKWQAEE